MGAITPQPMRPVGEADASIQVLMHHDVAAGQRASLHRFNLQLQILKADGIVAVHRALKLQREDQVQILAARTRHKRAPALCRLCLAKTSYTYKMNDLPQSSSSLGLFR